jgi:uncharacterized membrane protein YfcA
MVWYHYVLIIGAGVLAGFINTLAGSGSLLTLPMLMFIGLPPIVANGTNRIAIMLQSLVGSLGFRKQGALDMKTGMRLGIPSVIGSIVGALIALVISSKMMERAVGILLVIMFFIILFRPEVWLKGRAGSLPAESPVNFVIFFFIGVYGGFVQAGVGFFLLAGLVVGKSKRGQEFSRFSIYTLCPGCFYDWSPGGL